jgi:hypothetical protein
MLMVCAALAAVQAVISLAVSPMTPAIATTAPPVYAVVAGVHSIMPFLARSLTGRPWTATITAAITGVLVWPFSVIGPLFLVVSMTAGAAYDLVLLRSGVPGWKRLMSAPALSGAVLFLVSLPAFSPEHLTPGTLITTLVGRIVGQLIAVAVARAIAAGLVKSGVRAS